MNNKIKFSEWLNFQPKQRLATEMADKFQYTLYGGAGGGGKSFWLRKYIVRRLIKLWRMSGLTGIVAGLFCEDYPSLKDRQLSKISVEFPDWLGTRHADHKDFGNCYILHPEWGGGVIAFRNLDDPSKYKSSEFAIIGVDELTKNTIDTFHFLRFRMRWAGFEEKGIREQFIAGTNPGEVGHAWVKALWIDKVFPREMEDIKDRFAYIPATVDDNPYVGKGYIATLDSLPDALRKAVRYGSWDVFEGQYFKEWTSEKHVIDPFKIPPSWKKYRAYDHGYTAPACCKWYAVDEDGRVWVYRELYVTGLTVEQIAQQITLLSQGEEYHFSVSDPAIFANTGYVDKTGAQTIAETFARHGVVFIPGSNRRIDGWNLVHQYLRWEEGNSRNPIGKNSQLMHFSTCVNSIRTYPNLVHDKHKVEDLDTGGEDHAQDCDRYLLMAIHEGKTERPMTEIERRMAELRQSKELTMGNLNQFYGGDIYRGN